MQQVEQLRIKRTEAQKHLLSRKRKLSQLYSVTAYNGDRSDSSVNQLYFQQLQAFQDANNLEKGRFFDESTLPPRIRITRSSRITSNQPNTNHISYPLKDVRRPKSPSKSNGLLSIKPIESNHIENATSQTKNEDTPSQSIPGNDREHGRKLIVEINHGMKSPTILPPNVTNDPQSSPASTSGAVSTNTPAPDALSPNTSLGEPVPINDKSIDQISDIEIIPTMHKMSVSSLDVDMIDADPSAAFDSLQSPKESIKRPTIRIQTQNDDSYFQSIVETPGAMTGSVTPRQTPLSTPAIDSARRATRISSGALQKKSVSEILGETPRSTSPHADSPSSSFAKAAEKERKERERSKLSTVVFAKPQRPITESDTIEIAKVDIEVSGPKKERDYLYTLFESKAFSVNKQGSLTYLLQHSHKTLSTSDHLVDYEYQAQCRVLKRLYQLQSADRWALRQRKRAEEPIRSTSHWDFLLDHAKWLRTDFREERRWKLAAARALAESCADWVAANSEERKLLQIRVRKPEIDDGPGPAISSHPTPELDEPDENDSVSDDIADPRELSLSMAPAAIFSLGASEFMFVADKTPAFEKLINELPLYQPAQIEPDLSKSNLAEKFDARWKTDLIPISRFATEKIKMKEIHPPLKRSRYDYEIENSPPNKRIALPARETNVALFMSENKHIRDRIHPGHSFRPPSEHPMPAQQFFESRTSSQWTAMEDDELRKLVKDYSYNWSLISSCLSPRSLYTAGQDRRTPWECFERWIGLEGMPADMSKTPYFKTYSGRIEAAGRHVQAQIEEAQRRAGTNVPINIRKRTTQPVRVERKRAQRHLAMLDAMRKLAKKKEAVRQKAIHSADMAAMRKSNEVNQPRLGTKTPAEWSQIKYERELKMAKQQELYRQQLIAHQRAATQQRVQNPPTNGIPVPSQNVPGRHPIPVPNRPNQNLLGIPHVPVTGPKVVPPSRGIQASPQQIKMHQEQLIRQAQQNGSHSSPNVCNATMVNGQNNPAFLATMAQGNGQPSSPSGLLGNNSSPRPQSSHMGQALSSGHVPAIGQIAASIKERHPNMTDEEVTRVATQQLTAWQQQATAAAAGQSNRPRVNQAALNAAIGAANAAAAVPFNQAQGMMTNEQVQQYNQRMRMQQAQQHAVRGIQAPIPLNSTMVRPTSQHGQISRSGTPRDQRSGSVSNTIPNPGQPTTQTSQQGSPLPGQQSMQT